MTTACTAHSLPCTQYTCTFCPNFRISLTHTNWLLDTSVEFLYLVICLYTGHIFSAHVARSCADSPIVRYFGHRSFLFGMSFGALAFLCRFLFSPFSKLIFFLHFFLFVVGVVVANTIIFSAISFRSFQQYIFWFHHKLLCTARLNYWLQIVTNNNACAFAIHSQSIWSFLCMLSNEPTNNGTVTNRKNAVRENVSDTQATDCDDLYRLSIERFYRAVLDG